MDPNKTILINAKGEEREHALTDLQRGDPFPKVLILRARSVSLPSTVFAADNGEIAKRFWQVMVYRETPALFI